MEEDICETRDDDPTTAMARKGDAGRNEMSERLLERVWMGDDGKRGNLTCVIFHRAQHEKAYQKQLGVNQG